MTRLELIVDSGLCSELLKISAADSSSSWYERLQL